MSIPDVLLQQEQFSGWMMCFHRAMRRPLPWVRHCQVGQAVGGKALRVTGWIITAGLVCLGDKHSLFDEKL